MTKAKEPSFIVTVTDTFGGEANFCWLRRYYVVASTMRGAISKVSRNEGYRFRLDWNTGDSARYKARGACVCAYVDWYDPTRPQETAVLL